jgi:hypothetical protein
MTWAKRIDRLERAWMARRRGEPAPGTQMIAAGGATLRVRIVEPTGRAGAGAPTIVLAPDPPNVIEHLAALTDALARRHRVVCRAAWLRVLDRPRRLRLLGPRE